MPNFYCQFCGKEFKTEGGFDRHQDKCEKKARYEMLLINPDLYANMHLICGKLYGKQFYDQGNKEKIFTLFLICLVMMIFTYVYVKND